MSNLLNSPLNNNKMETRETLKEKNTQKRQSRKVSIANKYYLREAVSHLQSSVS